MLLCLTLYTEKLDVTSLICPKSQILPSSPPGDHNSRCWGPSSEGNLRPSLRYLVWVISKGEIHLYV